MRIFSKAVYCLSVVLVAAACDPVPKTTPDTQDLSFKINTDLQNILDSIITCDKKDAELPLSTIPTENKMSVGGEIQNQDIEMTDCDGKTTKFHGPIEEFEGTVEIAPPSNIGEAVRFVSIENPRTCATNLVDTEASLQTHDSALSSSTLVSRADQAGHLNLKISTATLIMNAYLNVHPGNNVLQITYFGKCQTARDPSDHPEMKDEYYRCLKAEKLGSKIILLKLGIKNVDISGVDKINSCEKN